MSLLPPLLFGPVRVGCQQVQDVVVQASALGLRFLGECGTPGLVIEAKMDGRMGLHRREGSTI